MERSTNALEELAEFLGKEAEPPSDSFKQRVIEKMGVDGYERYIARRRKFKRAQRIVAELAKVGDTANLLGKNYPSLFESSDALEKCRAIAEEGLEE